MPKKTITLRARQYRLLVNALQRLTKFHRAEDPLTAWTGLGTAPAYRPAVEAGLMTPVFPNDVYRAPKRILHWWKLTDLGAAIVAEWIRQGFDYTDIERGDLPPKRVTLHLTT